MNAFRVMFLKELRANYRSPMSFALLLVIPFLLIAIISQAFEPLFEGRDSFEVPLVDLDGSEQSSALVADLDALDAIEIEQVEWDGDTFSESDADDILDDDDRFTLIVIPDGYGDAVDTGEDASLALYSDPGQQAYSGLILDQIESRLMVEGLLGAFEGALAEEVGEEEAAETIQDEISPQVESPLLTIERRATEERKATPAAFEQTVPGFAVMFSFWLAVFIAASIQSEKRSFMTWRRTLVAPVPRATIVASRVCAYVLIGMAQVTVLFALGWAVFGLDLGDHPYALLPVFIALMLVTTAFGIFMTTLIRDFAALNSVMNLIVILAAAVGGALIPLFLLPGWVRFASPLVPHYWAMKASHGVMLLGDGVVETLPAVAALLGFAAMFFALAIWRFRFVD